MFYMHLYLHYKYVPNVDPTIKPFKPKLILAIPPTTRPAAA